MRLPVLLLAVAVAAAAAACATVPACPAKGGPTWRELTAGDVTLRTDLDEDDARETIRRLADVRAAMLAVFWPGAPPPAVRTNAVALRSVLEFTAFTRDPHSAPAVWGFRQPNPPFDPFIVLVGTDARSLRALTHELVHDLSAWYMPIQPAWYAEGLATFLETASYDRKSGLFEAGRPSPDHAWSSSKPFLAAVLLDDQFSETTPNLGAFEARARLLVDFLVNVHPREFDRLCAALEATKSTAEAWARALPDLPIDRLDQALDDYASRGQYLILRRALTIPAPEIKVREMPDAEVHVVRAQLLRTPTPGVRPDDEGARRELEEATAADPTNTGAFARRVVWYTPPRQRPQLAAAAQRLADAHPTDWLAWLLVGLTTTGAQHRTALVRALAIDPNQPAVLSDLAAIDLREGRFEDALAFATRGMSFRQNVWPLAFEAMQAQLALGHCEDAALLARVLSTRGPRTFRTLVLRVAAASACKPRGAEETPDRAPPHPGPP